jgi:hypothetical protein
MAKWLKTTTLAEVGQGLAATRRLSVALTSFRAENKGFTDRQFSCFGTELATLIVERSSYET